MHTTLVEYHRRLPDVDVRTVDGSHERLLCTLAGDAVDAAIMTGQATAWDGPVLPLWRERVIVAFPEHHALGQNPRIRKADLANENRPIGLSAPRRRGWDLRRLNGDN